MSTYPFLIRAFLSSRSPKVQTLTMVDQFRLPVKKGIGMERRIEKDKRHLKLVPAQQI